ncbi:MAG: LD-carboxypeptidase [Polaromonas sp.]|nr:LD-carboxypeptidase [Polaromonas sp.]
MKKNIYLYSPSSAVNDKAGFKRAVKRLITLGYEVEVDETALAIHQRFAGEDETRLAAIHRAAASGADVAMISRGGYGLTRLLPHIDYQAVEKAISKGMQFVGLSDFTAFQMALLAKTGAVTWAGPALTDFSSTDGVDDIMQACFDDLITGQGEGSGWRLPKLAAGAAEISAFTVEKAMLWWGNLAMLTSLVGTPYFPLIKNGILFIEDIGEHPYRIERMLAQLLQAGILGQQQAIIFGQFNGYKLASHDKGYKLTSVVEWLRSQVSIPVLTGLPFGHVPTKVLLPVGQTVTLAVEGRDAFLLWGHQH